MYAMHTDTAAALVSQRLAAHELRATDRRLRGNARATGTSRTWFFGGRVFRAGRATTPRRDPAVA